MKIIDKATMPDGTKIQLEDWSEDYPKLFGLVIAGYPIAQKTSEFGFIQYGKTMRVDIDYLKKENANEQAKADFEALKNGNKILKDLKERFSDRAKTIDLLGY